MDPHTGQVYSGEEIKSLPKEVQDRLIPVDSPFYTTNQPSRQKRRSRVGALKQPNSSYVEKRRAKAKRAKVARRKNRR